jgi:rhodanese-related sulfurtransferase
MHIPRSRYYIELTIALGFFAFWVGMAVLGILNQYNIPSVPSKDFHSWVEKHRPVIVDLRETEELQKEPLNYQPTIHLPFLYIESRLDSINIPQSNPILFVCSDGNRARLIASLLRKKGIKSYYLRSGLEYVEQEGFKDSRGQGKETINRGKNPEK